MENKMINDLIIIKLNNVSKEEKMELEQYLEFNCWDWKRINEQTIKSSNETIKSSKREK